MMDATPTPEKVSMEQTMQAMVRSRYGSPDVLELATVPRPEVGEDEVLVRIRAAGVNPLDWHLLTGTPYLTRLQAGFRTPKRSIPGADLAGVIEAVGPAVTEFQPGDEVYGEVHGAYAEYVAAKARQLAPKPVTMSFEEAAGVPVAALTALQALRDAGGLEPGQRVLVVGASGGVGSFAVQIAKALGAEVTGVASTRNLEMVQSLGADQVIDYTVDDFTKSGETFDLIIDSVGSASLSAIRRVLAPSGTYVMVGGPKRVVLGPVLRLVRSLIYSRFVSQRFVGMLAKISKDDLLLLKGLIEDGKVRTVIDTTYSLADARDALWHQGKGHARGKTVITI